MKEDGFSLVELLIATSLSAFVLIGISAIGASLARNQIEGIRSGTQIGWSVVSYMSMAKEIEDANVLVFPVNNGDAADQIVVCKNWSRNQTPGPPGGGVIDASTPVWLIQYCVDPAAATPPETGFKIRRYARVAVGQTCPTTGIPVSCDATGPVWLEMGQPSQGIVGYRVEKLPGFPFVFERANAIGGVRLRYAIGRQTPTPNEPTPKFTPFNFGISMAKQYSSTLD